MRSSVSNYYAALRDRVLSCASIPSSDITHFIKKSLDILEVVIMVESSFNLFFSVTWLKLQVNFKLRHEKTSVLNERLHDIEYKLKNYRHPCNRQQYHEMKHQMKTIADDLRHIDTQLQGKMTQPVNVESPVCMTPLSAGSSGYGSDMN